MWTQETSGLFTRLKNRLLINQTIKQKIKLADLYKEINKNESIKIKDHYLGICKLKTLENLRIIKSTNKKLKETFI